MIRHRATDRPGMWNTDLTARQHVVCTTATVAATLVLLFLYAVTC